MASEPEHHRLGLLEYGVLEDISKSPSSRNRAGSRVTSSHLNNASASSTASRLRPQVAAALELLTPEEVMEQEFDLELEDYGGSSDETTEDDEGETGRTSELFRIAEPLKQLPEVYTSEGSVLTEDDDKQLAIYGSLLGDEETLVDSDEENLIMKEIRAEITAQIRGEMKSELEMYKKKREALVSAVDEPDKDEDVDEQDPKLREAIIKMRKLDRILSRKVKREKEVKRDRILLQRRLHKELMSIKPEGGGKSREVQTNTAKFLALTLPPSHNLGVVVDEPEIPSPHPPITPVFATQYMDEGSISNRSGKSKQSNAAKSEGDSTTRSKLSQNGTASTTSVTEDSQSMYSAGTNSTNLTGKTRGNRKKNFLKRNKELAGDAANLIAMTEDEKQRVDNLLINLDALPEVPEECDAESVSGAAPSEYNPFAVVLADGEGFIPESGDIRKLEDIDSRLKALMPSAEFERIASTPRSVQSRQSVLFTRTALEMAGDGPRLGELVLQETKEERTFQTRLREIEDELNTLTSAVEHEMECPRLTSNQLQGLLDQCALTMQRATTETDALAQSQQVDLSESRAALLAAPPRLEEDVLQKLLTEARAEINCPSSPLTSASSTDGDVHDRQIESLSEENIRELLQDSRVTSRNMSRTADAIIEDLNGGSTIEDQYSPAVPKEHNWPMHSDDLHSPRTGDHSHVAQPNVNGYSPQPYGGSPRPTISDNLHLMSLDEEEMMAAIVSNGLEGDHNRDHGLRGDHNGDRRPFLPHIDPKGSLTTQRPNNSMYTMPVGEGSGKDSSWRSPGTNVYSSTSDHGGYSSRDDDTTPTPHPPNSGRPSNSRPSSGSAGKHRSVASRTPVD